MFRIKVVEKIETHILCSVNFFSPENRAVYEIMWKNIVEPGRPQMTIWRMRISRWIPKATHTHTHTQYVHAYWFSIATAVAQTHLIVRHTYIPCSVALFFSCFAV
jgi:hypothetical protein